MLPAFLTNNKVDPGSVRQVPVDGATKFTTFVNHQTDAATTYITSLPPPYFAQQDQFNLFMYSDSGLSMLADCLMVTDDTIRTNGDALRRFLRATVRAFKDCEAERCRVRAVREAVQGDRRSRPPAEAVGPVGAAVAHGEHAGQADRLDGRSRTG